MYWGVGGGHWVKRNVDRGRYFLLEDRSLWEVERFDRYTSSLWLSGDSITVLQDAASLYGYQLVNTSQRELASARFWGRGETTFVSEVIDYGRFVLLGDGTLWEIALLDRTTVSLWLSFASISVVADSTGLYPYTYRLLNSSDRHSAGAGLIARR